MSLLQSKFRKIKLQPSAVAPEMKCVGQNTWKHQRKCCSDRRVGPGDQSHTSTQKGRGPDVLERKWDCASQFRTIRAMIRERSPSLIMLLRSNQAWKKSQSTCFRERWLQCATSNVCLIRGAAGASESEEKLLENGLLWWLTKRGLFLNLSWWKNCWDFRN